MPRPTLSRRCIRPSIRLLAATAALLAATAGAAAERLDVQQHALTATGNVAPTRPALGSDATGEFVVYATRSGPGVPGTILLQHIDATGAPVGDPVTVSTGLTDDSVPAASGGRVVYRAYASGIWSVKLWEASTGTTRTLGTGIGNQLSINGDAVVWVGSDGILYYFDVTWSGLPPLALAGPDPAVRTAEIGDRYLVWSQTESAGQDNIWLYDLLSGFTMPVATDPLLNETNPSTSGLTIAWDAYPANTIPIPWIDLKAVTGDCLTWICPADWRVVRSDGTYPGFPSVDGDFIAYANSAITYDLYIYRVSDAATFQLTFPPVHVMSPRLAGNKIAFAEGSISSADVVVATFNFIPQVALSVAKAGAGTGLVSSTPAGIGCGATCSADFDAGSQVTLSAAPTGGSVFTGWDLCPGLGTCTVTMDAAQTVTATFAPPPPTWPLAVNFLGTGTGSVTATANGSPLALSCTSSGCTGAAPQGGSIVLTETPGASMIFKGWGIVCTGTAATCAFTMNASKTVSANFAPKTLALTVAMAGSSAGRVTSDAFDVDGVPVSIDCATGSTAGCSGAFPNGATVTLSATWDAAQVLFKGWSAAGCSGAPATCKVTLTDARSVTATFQPATYPLTVSVNGTGQGTVTGPGAGGTSINCTTGSATGCSAPEPNGPSVTLTAAPAAGSLLKGWSGCNSVSGTSCSVYMTAAKTVTATFEPASYPLTLTFVGSGTGAVTGVTWTSCDASGCAASVANGASVVLTESPTGASVWKGWGIVCAGTSTTCSFKMNAAKTVTATFWPQ